MIIKKKKIRTKCVEICLNLDNYRLQTIFINANYLMGGTDPDTGDWLGILGMVSFNGHVQLFSFFCFFC